MLRKSSNKEFEVEHAPEPIRRRWQRNDEDVVRETRNRWEKESAYDADNDYDEQR